MQLVGHLPLLPLLSWLVLLPWLVDLAVLDSLLLVPLVNLALVDHPALVLAHLAMVPL